MAAYTFPENYDNADCILIPVNASLVPHLSGAIKLFFERYAWLTDTDYERGYNAFAAIRDAMTGKCVADLIESNNRLYRLLDTALNGAAYASAPNPDDPDRPIVTPEIPPAPAASSPAQLGAYALRRRVERLINLADNYTTGQTYPVEPAFLSDGALTDDIGARETVRNLQGILNAGWFGIGGQRATLADLVNALRIGSDTDKDRIVTALEVLSGASSSATIFTTVRELFSDTAELTAEGATLGTIIASSIASAAMMGQLSGQLDRLIRAIDGGGLIGPEDNVLLALRGITAANELRNVIDSMGGAELQQMITEVEALLMQIRDKVQ